MNLSKIGLLSWICSVSLEAFVSNSRIIFSALQVYVANTLSSLIVADLSIADFNACISVLIVSWTWGLIFNTASAPSTIKSVDSVSNGFPVIPETQSNVGISLIASTKEV